MELRSPFEFVPIKFVTFEPNLLVLCAESRAKRKPGACGARPIPGIV